MIQTYRCLTPASIISCCVELLLARTKGSRVGSFSFAQPNYIVVLNYQLGLVILLLPWAIVGVR